MNTRALVLCACASLGCGQEVQLGPSIANDAGSPAADAATVPTSGFADLLAHDPTRFEFDFIHAGYGEIPNDAVASSPGPQLEYSHYFPGDLTVAFVGSEVGLIIDLGTDGEVATGLGIPESVSGGEGFTHLAFAAGTFNLQNAQAVVDMPTSTLESESHVLPGTEHVYVLRVVDTDSSPPLDLLVKLLVVSLSDANEVSFEWARLR